MTKDQIQIIKNIINEELASMPMDLPLVKKTIDGTIAIERGAKENLVSPADVTMIEPTGEYQTDSFKSNISDLVAPEDFVPQDVTGKYKDMKDITNIVAERLSVENRQSLFKTSHKAKLRIKQLREGSEELASLKYAIISEYVEGISQYIDKLTRIERSLKDQLKHVVSEGLDLHERTSTSLMLKKIEGNIRARLNSLNESGEDFSEVNVYLKEVVMPFIRFISNLEKETRFNLD